MLFCFVSLFSTTSQLIFVMRSVCKFHLVRGWCFVQGHNDHQCSGGAVLQMPSSMRLVFCTGSYDVTMIINVCVCVCGRVGGGI